MVDRNKPSRRFSAKEALQMILTIESGDLYTTDGTLCYYYHESSSESSSED